jgi:hypothetical protein
MYKENIFTKIYAHTISEFVFINKRRKADKPNFVVFCCVGSLALPKKDKIDPWRLAMLGIGSVRPGIIRPKSGSVRAASLLQLIVMMKSTIIHFKQFLIAA